jgi:hypothetical protein
MENNNINFNCKWCNKLFKRKSPKISHEHKQLCKPKSQRAYCSYCDISYNTMNEYKQHIMTESHIKKLITPSGPSIQKTTTVYRLDPYLSDNDKVVIDSTRVNNVILKYNDNTKETLNLSSKTELELDIENDINKAKHINDVNNRNYALSYQDIINNEIYNKPQPNDNQELILCKLVDANTEISDDKKAIFLGILKSLSEDDAEFMTTYIRDCNGIDLESKQIYLELLDKFILKLTQIYNQGYKSINGKDIKIFISKLSK